MRFAAVSFITFFHILLVLFVSLYCCGRSFVQSFIRFAGSSYGWYVNLLKPIGHVMHQQFNIQQLYALPTLYLCVLYLSENKQRLVPLTA